MKMENRKPIASMIAVACAVVLAAGQSQAAFTGFTAEEGYTNGYLRGQNNWQTAWSDTNLPPTAYEVDTTAAGYGGALGIAVMNEGWAFWSESVDLVNRGDTAVAKAVFRYNAQGQTPAANGQLMEIAFLGTGGNDQIRVTLRRTEKRPNDGNRSRMSFQLASTGTGGLSALALESHYEAHNGVGTTGIGQSDWLEFTAKLMRGKTRLDWKLDVIVKNLQTGEVAIAGRWTIKSSSNFFNVGNYIARLNGKDIVENNIVAGSRQIDSYEIYSYPQTILYDEVCDGNIDGAKSKTEETSTQGASGNWTIDNSDPWYHWGYLASVNFIGSVGHDAFGKFGSHKSSDWAVNQTGRKWISGIGRSPDIGETVEWSVNYRMTAAPGDIDQPHLDLYLTANGIALTSGTDASTKIAYATNQVADVEATYPNEYMKMLGVRISQYNSHMAIHLRPAINYSSVGSSNTVTGFIPLSDIGIAGTDREGDHLNVAFRAKKLETPTLWDCSVIISNIDTGATWTFAEDGLANAPLYYSGASIYPTVYSPKAFNDGDGFEIDDLICRIYYSYAFTGPWNIYATEHGLSGVKTADWDNDGMNDWGEYVFGGNPTNPASMGALPTYDGVSGAYTFPLRGDPTIVAHVMTNADLVNGAWGLFETISVGTADGVVSNYTSIVDTVGSAGYIKLEVE